ncbi:MAG TPA: hypothetical protein VM681_06400 [Candidatus Thermoplasmatota archaeon]|nr:hypothetical protein [Candidatus Thermoplasmatota archaeon]
MADAAWQRRLRERAIGCRFSDHDLLYDAGLWPAVPPEYKIAGLVGLTFRLAARASGGHVYVTALDVGAAARLGARLGLDPAASVAMVDSHERVHVALQLEDEGLPVDKEEAHSRWVDAVWLSLRHPRAEALVRAGDFGLVEHVDAGFWEALVLETRD